MSDQITFVFEDAETTDNLPADLQQLLDMQATLLSTLQAVVNLQEMCVALVCDERNADRS